MPAWSPIMDVDDPISGMAQSEWFATLIITNNFSPLCDCGTLSLSISISVLSKVKMRKLKYERNGKSVVVDMPDQTTISQTLVLLQDEDLYFFDIEDSINGYLIQVADCGDAKYMVQVFSLSENEPTLYSDPTEISMEAALAFCCDYVQHGKVRNGHVSFSIIDWSARQAALSSSTAKPPQISWEQHEFEESEITFEQHDFEEFEKQQTLEEIEKNPQKFFNITLRDRISSELLPMLIIALERGATIERFKPSLPLIYHAKRGDAETVATLVALGCDVTAIYNGNSIVWHALSHKNFQYASALVAHGATGETAQSSPYYSDWLVAFENNRVTEAAIISGALDTVRLKIADLPRSGIKNGWLSLAIIHDQLEVLTLLLHKKCLVHFHGQISNSAYGDALAKTDTRFLQILIEHGAYASVSKARTYGGLEFISASPEALLFLTQNGYTTGLGRGVATIIRHNRSNDCAAQLAVIDNVFFENLNQDHFLRAISIFAKTNSIDRIAALLEQREHAPLTQACCEAEDLDTLSVMIMAGLTLVTVPSSEYCWRTNACCHYIRTSREKLISIATAIGEDRPAATFPSALPDVSNPPS
jgi:hypothetical protein